MTSVCTSLRTDPEVSEFDENLLNSSQHLNFELPPDPTLIENIENLFNNFPETSLSISSSHDNSDEVRFVKAKNIEMKEALRINVWKLKAASEKIVNSPNSKRFEEIIEEAKQKKKSAMELVAFSNLQTGDTENNAEILQEIAINIKNLKKIARDLGETVDDDELLDLIRKADSDNDGQVSFDDFYSVMTKKF